MKGFSAPRFASAAKRGIEAIVEAFSNLEGDLNKEKKGIMRQWAKREHEIGRVMQAAVSMYGDLQGIDGKTLLEIDGKPGHRRHGRRNSRRFSRP